MKYDISEITNSTVTPDTAFQRSTSANSLAPVSAGVGQILALSAMFATCVASQVAIPIAPLRSWAVHEWHLSYQNEESNNVVTDDTELDSPSWASPQREALRLRGYKRINDPRMTRESKV